MYKYNHILLGGTGFIGAELALALQERDGGVLAVGRQTEGVLPRGVLFKEVELTNEGGVESVIYPTKNISILLGQNYQNFDKAKELELLHRIVTVLNSLDVPTRVFYFSSALVYGDTFEPASEDGIPQPVDVYSQFKYEAEQLLQEALAKKHQLRILRLANVYGSPKNKGFIGLLMKSVSSKMPFTLNGGGLQERDYMYIDDIVGAILAISENQNESQCEVINIATGVSSTLNQVVATMQELLVSPIEYLINDMVPQEVKVSRIDNKKLRDTYQYAVQFPLKEGLQRTWEKYQLH
ncbi:MAG: NAD(P)-dependent oxidoreductase [Candidatus Moranbacteria bacterium]|nr:NAD(P)-dependent oxidoreductase [Candidatus Moranbacteria bacterium]